MLAQSGGAVAIERSARREPLSDDEARSLLNRVDRVVIARGKSRREQAATETSLEDLQGPTGNYRAPMVITGRTLVVGLALETLDALL